MSAAKPLRPCAFAVDIGYHMGVDKARTVEAGCEQRSSGLAHAGCCKSSALKGRRVYEDEEAWVLCFEI